MGVSPTAHTQYGSAPPGVTVSFSQNLENDRSSELFRMKGTLYLKQ